MKCNECILKLNYDCWNKVMMKQISKTPFKLFDYWICECEEKCCYNTLKKHIKSLTEEVTHRRIKPINAKIHVH